jgi:hypothetical protein
LGKFIERRKILKKYISFGSLVFVLIAFGFLGFSSGSTSETGSSSGQAAYAPIPDFSGLQWVDGKRFLAVHDAKNPKSPEEFPRVSMVWLPENPAGIGRKSLTLDWPEAEAPASDLESISRLPGTNKYLLVESGSSSLRGRVFKRAFLVEMKGESLSMIGSMELPAVVNIEGTAVAKVSDGYVFLWAERADNEAKTTIWHAPLKLAPLSLGKAKGSVYKPAGFTGRYWRPVSALEIDSKGVIYAASAYDTDDDSGPFNSVVWRIGRIDLKAKSSKAIALDPKPTLIAQVDGIKIEALSVVENAGSYELFYGFDDENFGGGLRRILLKNRVGR